MILKWWYFKCSFIMCLWLLVFWFCNLDSVDVLENNWRFIYLKLYDLNVFS